MSYLTKAELDIYKDPKYAKKLNYFSHSASQENILCGDNITLELVVKNNQIINAGFQAKGCILNTISASKLVDSIINKPLKDINLDPKIWLNSLNFTVPAGRTKCVLLCLETLKQALAS